LELVGVLFVVRLNVRRELPKGFKRPSAPVCCVILLNLGNRIRWTRFIDNAAHMATVIGAALAAVVVTNAGQSPGSRLRGVSAGSWHCWSSVISFLWWREF